jgi:hypothetical protein
LVAIKQGGDLLQRWTFRLHEEKPDIESLMHEDGNIKRLRLIACELVLSFRNSAFYQPYIQKDSIS